MIKHEGARSCCPQVAKKQWTPSVVLMTWKHTDQNILSVVLQAPGVIVLASPAPVKHTGGDVWQQTNKDYSRQNVLHGGLQKPKWGSVKLCQVKLARHKSATVMWERSTQLTVVSRPQINSRWRRKPRDGPSQSQHGCWCFDGSVRQSASGRFSRWDSNAYNRRRSDSTTWWAARLITK